MATKGGNDMASQISLSQLGPNVDKAVKAALDRHRAKATNGFVINPGIIAGPLLDVATDIKVAQKIAEEVTEQVHQAGGLDAAATAKPVSAVLWTPRGIICGFFPYPVPEVIVK
jgi:hypothetical protein